ncbi:MAG: non-heme iron oxygenase ferredoxin subunit [Thaumarchaeota archaeon]|jgi:nitrite reductase/ring-hydroxylating ferredoxin subunit|nr:non-heme iron oxygenase ferredoxin subunit [Nitrososphaerota archaeon]
MGKILVGKTSEMPPGKLNKVSVDGKEVLVVNLDGNYFAMDDTCTHSGASLSEGQLDGSTVTCPWHGSTWDCKTGKLEKFPAKINDLKSYKVTVESDNIFLEA